MKKIIFLALTLFVFSQIKTAEQQLTADEFLSQPIRGEMIDSDQDESSKSAVKLFVIGRTFHFSVFRDGKVLPRFCEQNLKRG